MLLCFIYYAEGTFLLQRRTSLFKKGCGSASEVYVYLTTFIMPNPSVVASSNTESCAGGCSGIFLIGSAIIYITSLTMRDHIPDCVTKDKFPHLLNARSKAFSLLDRKISQKEVTEWKDQSCCKTSMQNCSNSAAALGLLLV